MANQKQNYNEQKVETEKSSKPIKKIGEDKAGSDFVKCEFEYKGDKNQAMMETNYYVWVSQKIAELYKKRLQSGKPPAGLVKVF